MAYTLETSSLETKEFVLKIKDKISEIIKESLIGIYLHGSLAMGGFNPNSSDVDVLVVTKKSLSVVTKRNLAELFLHYSASPFPIEISFLNEAQLKDWHHPCPFDFHYSEFWRERYENDLAHGTFQFLNNEIKTDADLAAHITILNNRGICLYGKPVNVVFPLISQADYLSSIMDDFEDCMENIERDPVYCTLNLLRVYWYLKEGVISSKQEGGEWGLSIFTEEMAGTIKKAVDCYSRNKNSHDFERHELDLLKNYISDQVIRLMDARGTS
ncbi:aminoglycoside adenylyltransferase domain-containing protein [Bacillus sp. P14.5]|uniref:aminoglycoside adenylyltransferase domain-containing protein n=1 Tax=Bacillus sp. P14.5 TaxID=1983400 RepID=UPI000DEAFF10|nr:aminoglycoside adenylyltransferase domain-containing protein [Bacillus sp. P14.5]